MDGHGEFEGLDDLGDELRQSVGGEFRRAAEEDEYDAAKAQMRSRTLEHVAYELLARGDTVAVTIQDEVLRGSVVNARGDLLALETLHGDRVDVHLGGLIALHVVHRAGGGGLTRDRFAAESFVARLRELELEEISVAITVPAARGPVAGVIEAVTSDHAMVRDADGGHWYLPLAGIAAVAVR